MGVNTSEIEAPFVLGDRSHAEVVADVRKKLSVIPGVKIEIGQPISHRIDAMLSGTQARIAIKLFGDDLNRMFMLGNQIKKNISAIDGVVDLNVEQQIERPQLKITPRREMLARYGVSLSEFAEFIDAALAGEVVSQVYEGSRTFDLTVKVKDDERSSVAKIGDLMVDTQDGKVPLSYLAEIKSATGPNTINRENVKRKIVISANVSDRDLRSVVDDIRERIDETVVLPEGYFIEYGGQFESEAAASDDKQHDRLWPQPAIPGWTGDNGGTKKRESPVFRRILPDAQAHRLCGGFPSQYSEPGAETWPCGRLPILPEHPGRCPTGIRRPNPVGGLFGSCQRGGGTVSAAG